MNAPLKLDPAPELEAAERLARLWALPYEPLPPELEDEAQAAFDEVERSIRAGERGLPPEEIKVLLARMRAEQGEEPDLDP